MVPTTSPPQPLYTSAPILDYDEELPEEQQLPDEDLVQSTGVMTLEGEAFDAAILEALVNP